MDKSAATVKLATRFRMGRHFMGGTPEFDNGFYWNDGAKSNSYDSRA
jgi:hypothetical protein